MGGWEGGVFLAVNVLLFFSLNAYVFVDMILGIIGYHYSWYSFIPRLARNAPSLQTYFFSSFLFMCPSLRTGIQQNLWRLCVIYRCHGHNDSTVRSCMDRCHRNKDDVLATVHMESTSRTQSYDFVSSHQLPTVHFCSLEGRGRGGLKDRGLDSFKFNCSFFKTRERERERTRKL